MKKSLLSILCVFSLFAACVVQTPKYAGVDQVFELKTKMSKQEVDRVLGIGPYSLKSKDDSETVYIYKYRATERRTFPLFQRKTNGMKSTGKYMDLSVVYDTKTEHVQSMKSKPAPKDAKGKYSIDVNSVFTLLTVTAPALLVYLGLQHTK
jgi:hypothetical protein